ncbi:MAG: exo-alpha-sialidase [Bryobacterales bacterium]|nr:exo-alpha-sialidase [Bryobacterales bacterium]
MRYLCLLLVSTALAATQSEFIYEKAPFPSCHASTIVELKNGELMAAWFGGTDEGAKDVAIWGSRRAGGAWSAPVELAREANQPTWNPVLFHTIDGTLWLYYKFGPSPMTWTAARRFSRDEGRTWSEIERLPAGILGPIRAKPLVLGDGTIVSGTSVESYRSWAVWIERSTDNGKTWTKTGPITVPRTVPRRNPRGSGPAQVPGVSEWDFTDGLIQPSVVAAGGKRLRLYARATSSIGRICVAESNDAGVTWSAARLTELPNPNSGLDAVTLRDGRMVMIYNHTERGRTPLNLAVSRDGESWTMFQALETEPGEYSYPNVIQGADGDLHITYTWKRQRVRYARVALGDVPAK